MPVRSLSHTACVLYSKPNASMTASARLRFDDVHHMNSAQSLALISGIERPKILKSMIS